MAEAKKKTKKAVKKAEEKVRAEKPKAKKEAVKKTGAAKKAKPSSGKKTPSKAKKEKPSVKEEALEAGKKVSPAPKKRAEEGKKEEAPVKVEAAEKKKKKVKVKKSKPVEKIKYLGEPKEKIKRKPSFKRQELSFRKKLDDVWRRPRGIDSKQLEGKRGKGAVPSIGYGSVKGGRGVHPTGLKPCLVENVSGLSALKPEVDGAVIAAQVGRRKRNEIIREANKQKIVVLNPRKGER